MVCQARGSGTIACPHIERNDLRCCHRFALSRIEQAFSVCMGAFHACPMFHRLNGEEHASRAAADKEGTHDGDNPGPATADLRLRGLGPGFPESDRIAITERGRSIALRPTGT